MRSTRDGGRVAVGLFATTLVMAMGLMCCVSIVTSSSADPTKHLVGCVALFLMVAYFLLSLRRNPSQTTEEKQPFWLFRLFKKEKQRRDKEYFPRRKKNWKVKQIGGNPPPTVESLRQQINHLNTWVAEDKKASPRRQNIETKNG